MEAVAKLNARLCELTRQASAKIMPEATVGFRRAKRINEQVRGIGKQGSSTIGTIRSAVRLRLRQI